MFGVIIARTPEIGNAKEELLRSGTFCDIMNLKETTVKKYVKSLIAEKLLEMDEGFLFLKFIWKICYGSSG